MKLIDSLNSQQKVEILSGQVVGFFPYMVLSQDAFYEHLYELCLGYYFQRSGEKQISVTYEKFKMLTEENSNITKSAEQLLGELIRGKFIDKWTRLYNSLVTEKYNVLLSNEITKTKEANNSDNVTFNTSVEDNGSTSSKETISRTTDNDDDVFGFNSSSPVGDTKSKETVEETTEGSADDNTTHNVQTKTGTENRALGVDETESISGRNVSGADMIEKELDLRTKHLFFDIIYRDIDSIATLQIYI